MQKKRHASKSKKEVIGSSGKGISEDTGPGRQAYFEMIKLLEKYALAAGRANCIFQQKDLARIPKDFEQEVYR